MPDKTIAQVDEELADAVWDWCCRNDVPLLKFIHLLTGRIPAMEERWGKVWADRRISQPPQADPGE